MLLTAKDLIWTNHAKEKLAFYGLSEKRVLRILRHPSRTEEGIAEGTLASNQIAGSKKHPYEVWVMYQLVKSKPNKKEKEVKNFKKIKTENQSDFSKKYKVKIISAWKYPGISPKGKPIPIPEEILKELGL